MSNLQLHQPLLPAAKTARALARLSDETGLAVAVIHARAEVEVARARAVVAVGGSALHEVALLSQLEQSLAVAVPHASGRLATVADLTALAVADGVVGAAQRIGR